MGYALKINNANFASVAVDQVSFIDAVPCTNLQLDKSTLSFDTVNESKALVATKTPSNTTDPLTWASSNENVATVSNGVVTIHGIGSATITATCGTQSASVTILQESIKAQYALVHEENRYVSEMTVDTKQILTSASGTATLAYGQAYHNDDKLRVVGLSNTECIPVPYGATKIHVKTTDDVAVSISYGYIVDTTSLIAYNSANYPEFVSKTTFVNTNTGLAVSYGQAVMFRPATAQQSTLDYVYFT